MNERPEKFKTDNFVDLFIEMTQLSFLTTFYTLHYNYAYLDFSRISVTIQ